MKRRLLIEVAIAAIAMLSIVQQSFGRGSLASENPWSTEHIGSLPSEIRSERRKWEIACGDVDGLRSSKKYATRENVENVVYPPQIPTVSNICTQTAAGNIYGKSRIRCRSITRDQSEGAIGGDKRKANPDQLLPALRRSVGVISRNGGYPGTPSSSNIDGG